MTKSTTRTIEQTVGLDVGDRWTHVCVLENKTGEVVERSRLRTSPGTLEQRFCGGGVRVVLEVGGQSAWISRLLSELGNEVVVANARQLALIYQHRGKSDAVDAETLARLGRLDPKLLSPLEHGSEQAQLDRAILRARDLLVRSRSSLIAHVRATAKAFGSRIGRCSAEAFARRAAEDLPEPLLPALGHIVDEIAALSAKIRSYDREIDQLAEEPYQVSALLRQVDGVGSLTALAFLLRIEDPSRFRRSRTVGAYLGLVPRRDQSGQHDPQLRITKSGDPYVRRLLVQAAHYILGPFGKDSALRRYGLRIAARGGKNAKKRAAVAVARKLAVLLHHLWITGEVYEPMRGVPTAPQTETPPDPALTGAST